MRRIIQSFALCLAAASAAPAIAGPFAQALGDCLADKSTGRDHKDLARWMFAAMSANPELRKMYDVPPALKDQLDHTAADIFMRMMTVDCRDESIAAVRNEGPRAAQSGFGKLGEVAMKDLIADPAVMTSISGLDKYFDRDRLRALLPAN